MTPHASGKWQGASDELTSPCSLLLAPCFSRRSFSLIEVVISMAILSVGLIGAIRVFPVGLRASKRAEMISRATLVAERNLESFKLKSWSELETLAGGGSLTSVEGDVTVVMSVTQPQVQGLVDPSSLLQISTSVSWLQEGRMRSLDLVTYLREP